MEVFLVWVVGHDLVNSHSIGFEDPHALRGKRKRLCKGVADEWKTLVHFSSQNKFCISNMENGIYYYEIVLGDCRFNTYNVLSVNGEITLTHYQNNNQPKEFTGKITVKDNKLCFWDPRTPIANKGTILEVVDGCGYPQPTRVPMIKLLQVTKEKENPDVEGITRPTVASCTDDSCVNGTCSVKDLTTTCTCQTGWYGDKCDEQCNDSHSCGDNGTCKSTTSANPFYHFNTRTLFPRKPCYCKDTCSDTDSSGKCEHGTCSTDTSTGAKTCTCQDGWSGALCNTATAVIVREEKVWVVLAGRKVCLTLRKESGVWKYYTVNRSTGELESFTPPPGFRWQVFLDGETIVIKGAVSSSSSSSTTTSTCGSVGDNGTCKSTTSALGKIVKLCSCNKGAFGTYCKDTCSDTDSSGKCEHGTCSTDTSTGAKTCTCQDGWSGALCNTATAVIVREEKVWVVLAGRKVCLTLRKESGVWKYYTVNRSTGELESFTPPPGFRWQVFLDGETIVIKGAVSSSSSSSTTTTTKSHKVSVKIKGHKETILLKLENGKWKPYIRGSNGAWVCFHPPPGFSMTVKIGSDIIRICPEATYHKIRLYDGSRQRAVYMMRVNNEWAPFYHSHGQFRSYHAPSHHSAVVHIGGEVVHIAHRKPCSDNPCMNHGRCTDEGVSFSCACDSNWSGSRCETPRRGSQVHISTSGHDYSVGVLGDGAGTAVLYQRWDTLF
eukprot:sb/3462517/